MKNDIKLQNWRASLINSTAAKHDFNSYNTLPTVKAQINEYGLKEPKFKKVAQKSGTFQAFPERERIPCAHR